MSSQRREVHGIIAGILRQLKSQAPLSTRNESMTWLLQRNSLPIWSRRLSTNMEGMRRSDADIKWHNFEIEITDCLWSLWGGLHPRASWFDSTVRGRQTLGCYVVACCAASAFRRLGDWNAKLLDAIVVNGDRYYRECVANSQCWDHHLGIDDLSVQCSFQNIKFMVQLELVAFGKLYSAPASTIMSLSEALNYFFTRYQWGILVCEQRRFAFGYTSTLEGGYFLYDCVEWDWPVFPDNMGASYVLRTKQLMLLLYCMVTILNVRQKNVEFRLYNVDIVRVPQQKTRSKIHYAKTATVKDALNSKDSGADAAKDVEDEVQLTKRKLFHK